MRSIVKYDMYVSYLKNFYQLENVIFSVVRQNMKRIQNVTYFEILNKICKARLDPFRLYLPSH